jgi:hypothetical protein
LSFFLLRKRQEKAWHAFSGEIHLLKGEMRMAVACILLSLVAMLSAWIAIGLAISANENNEKDRPSRKD